MLKKFQNLKGNSATFFVELSKLKEGLWSGKNNIKILADCSDEEILNFAEIQNFLGRCSTFFKYFAAGSFFRDHIEKYFLVTKIVGPLPTKVWAKIPDQKFWIPGKFLLRTIFI